MVNLYWMLMRLRVVSYENTKKELTQWMLFCQMGALKVVRKNARYDQDNFSPFHLFFMVRW